MNLKLSVDHFTRVALTGTKIAVEVFQEHGVRALTAANRVGASAVLTGSGFRADMGAKWKALYDAGDITQSELDSANLVLAVQSLAGNLKRNEAVLSLGRAQTRALVDAAAAKSAETAKPAETAETAKPAKPAKPAK